ncbi:MAG TPA: hypothetical protein PKA98_07215, partial [Acidimicrobiales bacterium]|nr:hypothetical protein [Acidimicrobiales bacterium]
AVLGECTEPWPPEASELDELVDELDWALWLPVRAADTSGWQLRIAVADPVEGRSYALEAVDQSLSDS